MVQCNDFNLKVMVELRGVSFGYQSDKKCIGQFESPFEGREILWSVGNERLRQDHAFETDCW